MNVACLKVDPHGKCSVCKHVRIGVVVLEDGDRSGPGGTQAIPAVTVCRNCIREAVDALPLVKQMRAFIRTSLI